jgi:subtilisin family serine protease
MNWENLLLTESTVFLVPANEVSIVNGNSDLSGSSYSGEDGEILDSLPIVEFHAAGGSIAIPISGDSIWRNSTEDVPTIDPNKAFPLSQSIDPLAASRLIGLDRLRDDPQLDSFDGSGYSVAIIDTGIDLNHPFFGGDSDNNGIADRIIYQQDFADGDLDATDYNGHGSHIASIIGSSEDRYPGVAPSANIIALKVFANRGYGDFNYVEKALQWVISNAAKYRIASVNLSFGDNKNWQTAANRNGVGDELATLAGMGVTPVVASGNDFYYYDSAIGVAAPAADNNVISVGGVYALPTGTVVRYEYPDGGIATEAADDRMAPFSQRHPDLTTILAPAAPIVAANANGGTMTLHGNSQAAAYVSGTVAVAQQIAAEVLSRQLSFAEVKSLLVKTGKAIVDGDDEVDNVTNTNNIYRRLDIFALAMEIGNLRADRPNVRIFASDAMAMETKSWQSIDSGEIRFDRTGKGEEELTVKYRVVSNTAAGQDYIIEGLDIDRGIGTVTFAKGSKTVTVKVLPKDDLIFERKKTISFQLLAGDGYRLDTRSNAEILLLDNDLTSVGIKSIQDLVEENRPNTIPAAGWLFTRTGDLSKSLTVYFLIDGTATNGIDYKNLDRHIIFNPNSATAKLDLLPTADVEVEGTETIVLSLRDGSNYRIDRIFHSSRIDLVEPIG